MRKVTDKPILGIDASQANQLRKTGVSQVAYALIQELKQLIPDSVRVRLYSPTPLREELASLPSHWSSRVLAWPFGKFWPQLRLGWEMRLHPPDLFLALTHLLPWSRLPRTICVVNDIGFERFEALYGTSAEVFSRRRLVRLLLDLAIRTATRGCYRLSEQDYHRWSMRRALGCADHIVVCSEFTREEMQAAYGSQVGHLEVIPWAIDPTPYATPVPLERLEEVLQRYRLCRPYLLFVGRLEVKKNVRRLVEGFALLHHQYRIPHQLVLAGMPGNGYEEIQAAIQSHGLEGIVVETGWLPQEYLPLLLQGADAFLFPSLYEGFGLPILEAQSAGIPLVCSDLPVMREVAADGAVFFDPRDPAELAAVVYALLANEYQRHRCVEAGRRNAARFNWQKTAKAYWKLLAEELALSQ